MWCVAALPRFIYQCRTVKVACRALYASSALSIHHTASVIDPEHAVLRLAAPAWRGVAGRGGGWHHVIIALGITCFPLPGGEDVQAEIPWIRNARKIDRPRHLACRGLCQSLSLSASQ